MIRLLGILILILSIVLFPPAALALVSNNAVPGDATYPIKRVLEDGIFAVASLNPTSKAWFAAARSDRRFKEVQVLITQGKQAKVTLKELVAQANTTVEEISKIEDPAQKKQLLKQFHKNIDEYKQGLTELKKQVSKDEKPTVVQPTPTPTIQPRSTSAPIPTSAPLPTSTALPSRPPRPTAKPTAIPTPTPTPTATPTVPPASQPPAAEPTDEEDINEAIEDLDKIKKKTEQKSLNSAGVDNFVNNTVADNSESNTSRQLSQGQQFSSTTQRGDKTTLSGAGRNPPPSGFVSGGLIPNSSPTPTPTPAAACNEGNCNVCTTATTCGMTNLTYSACQDNLGQSGTNLCKNGATAFHCWAPDSWNGAAYLCISNPSGEENYPCSVCLSPTPTPTATPPVIFDQTSSSSE